MHNRDCISPHRCSLLTDRCLLGCRIARSGRSSTATSREIATLNTTLGHSLITPEVRALKRTLRGNQLAEHIARNLMLVLIPSELFAGESQAILGQDSHPTIELPNALLVKVIGSIALDVAIDVKLLIKLFQQYALIENLT